MSQLCGGAPGAPAEHKIAVIRLRSVTTNKNPGLIFNNSSYSSALVERNPSRLQSESPRTAAAGNGLARLGAQRRTRTKRTGLGRQSRSDCGSERRGCEAGDYRSPRSKRKSESWESRSTSSIPPEILSIIYLTFFEARTVCRNPPIVGTRHAR